MHTYLLLLASCHRYEAHDSFCDRWDRTETNREPLPPSEEWTSVVARKLYIGNGMAPCVGWPCDPSRHSQFRVEQPKHGEPPLLPLPRWRSLVPIRIPSLIESIDRSIDRLLLRWRWRSVLFGLFLENVLEDDVPM